MAANFRTDSLRRQDSDNLVKRVSEGLLSSKYKAIDYDKLKQLTAEKKFSAHLSLAKVKKLEDSSKQHKEQNLQKQHKRVWDEELIKQNAHRRRAQADLDLFIQQNRDSSLNKHFFNDFEDYEGFLEEGFAEFKKTTVDPIWTLRDDLLYWVHQHQSDLKAPSQGLEQEHKRVLQTVQSVKDQQRRILEQLRNEQASLENELRTGELPEIINPTSTCQINTGIPLEAFELECPDDELKADVLEEFIHVDEKYMEKMGELEKRHIRALGSDTGGWSSDDHLAFLCVIEQYPFDVQKRRTLYMDRLRRQFPKMSRNDLVEHEEWWFHYKYFHERKKALINDWIRDRKELLQRTEMVFTEAKQELELAEAKAEHLEQQRQLRRALCEKVTAWRVRKMEVMRLRHQVAEAAREKELRELQLQQEKEQARRKKQKEKIDVRRQQQEEQRRLQAEADERRLQELQHELEEQAAYDQQRVVFRAEQYQKKLEEKEMKELRRREEEEERQRVLESLREQVRPHVEGDLQRLWADTEAWQNHTKRPEYDEPTDLQKPLFEINTFSSKQVTADPRVRLEGKLREAGLINTDYAKQAILNMQPAGNAQRRDMVSTLFKQDQT